MRNVILEILSTNDVALLLRRKLVDPQYLIDKAADFCIEMMVQARTRELDQDTIDVARAILFSQFSKEFRGDPKALVANAIESAAGLVETADAAVEAAEDRYNKSLEIAQQAEADRIKAEKLAELESQAQAEREKQALKLADEQMALRQKQETAKQAESSGDAPKGMSEPDLRAVEVAKLPIHGGAIGAYAKAGLTNVGLLLDYKATRSLTEISGIAEDRENDTLEAIENLRTGKATIAE